MKQAFSKTLLFCQIIFACIFLPAQTQHVFTAAQANASVTFGASTDNYVYVSSAVTKLNKLFLFLPGSNTQPGAYLDILKTAANLGYNALVLNYVNNISGIPMLCSDSGQGDVCVGLTEQEMFYGGGYAKFLTAIDSQDCIRRRVIDALTYLNTTYPADGWGQFLDGPDSILWTSICISGHSMGAAIASHIAYWYLVNRGAFFATGGDPYGTAVALWMDGASATPPSRKYTFTHMQDERYWLQAPLNSNYTPMIWDTLGLFTYGGYLDVDTLSTNFYGSHTFTSDTTISSGNTLIYHDCVIEDAWTPLTTSGTPTFQPLWQYMLTDSSAITSCTPSVLVSSNTPDTICSSTVVTFTATPTNGGTSPAYIWYVNSAVVSTAVTYADSALNNNDSVWVVMTSNATCASPITASSVKTLAPSYNANGGSGTWTWTGNKTTNWFEACNWDKLSLPDALSDVIIPGGTTNQPTISGATGYCKTITINSDNGGLLTVATSSSGVLNVVQ